MISVFNREKLIELLRDFYRITKIRITVFDENGQELMAYPEGLPEFCKIVRSCETGILACAACDREACDKAARQRVTQIYRCHAGLTEAVTPLVVGDMLAGYLFFGHVFSYPNHSAGWEEIRKQCAHLPIDLDHLEPAVRKLPIIDQDYVRSATKILLAVASYLVIERMATLQTDQLAVKLDRYLTAHVSERLAAQDLCRAFGIGKTQLYKLSKELYGCGIAQHIRDMRLEKAKELLLAEPALSLEEISERCGFHDYNYFNSVFSHHIGSPPGAWRRKNS